MPNKRIDYFLALLGAALLAACGQQTSTPAATIKGQAQVQSVEVAEVLGSQGSLMALVHGTLPDGCTKLGEPAITPGGALIVVILPTYRYQDGQTCSGGASTYERVVPLGSSFAPGTYTVSVNGVQTVFELQGQSTHTATAAATETPLPSPTNTPTPEPTMMPTNPPEPTPTEAVTPASPKTVPTLTGAGGGCENKAAFFADVTVPDGTLFDPGTNFTKTWRIRNAGTCSWKGYTLVFQDGDLLGSSSPQPLPGSLAPGDTVDISVKMTAPEKPGGYYSNWLLSTNSGDLFGLGNPGVGLIWTKIGVRSLVPTSSNQPVCAYQTGQAVEAQVLQLVNAARQERGLDALLIVPALSAAARGHSQDMACNDFVEHYGSDGSTWFARIQAEGVKYHSASENIYAGNPQFGGTADGAFTWWMNSQVHRDNILNPKAKQIGVGYVYNASSTYKGYYTLNFIEP